MGEPIPTELETELLEAAHFVDHFAKNALANDTRAAARAFSRKLRARAERVRELATLAEQPTSPFYADKHSIRMLAGPLPATPPYTPGDPQEKGPTR